MKNDEMYYTAIEKKEKAYFRLKNRGHYMSVRLSVEQNSLIGKNRTSNQLSVTFCLPITLSSTLTNPPKEIYVAYCILRTQLFYEKRRIVVGVILNVGVLL